MSLGHSVLPDSKENPRGRLLHGMGKLYGTSQELRGKIDPCRFRWPWVNLKDGTWVVCIIFQIYAHISFIRLLPFDLERPNSTEKCTWFGVFQPHPITRGRLAPAYVVFRRLFVSVLFLLSISFNSLRFVSSLLKKMLCHVMSPKILVPFLTHLERSHSAWWHTWAAACSLGQPFSRAKRAGPQRSPILGFPSIYALHVPFDI